MGDKFDGEMLAVKIAREIEQICFHERRRHLEHGADAEICHALVRARGLVILHDRRAHRIDAETGYEAMLGAQIRGRVTYGAPARIAASRRTVFKS